MASNLLAMASTARGEDEYFNRYLSQLGIAPTAANKVGPAVRGTGKHPDSQAIGPSVEDGTLRFGPTKGVDA